MLTEGLSLALDVLAALFLFVVALLIVVGVISLRIQIARDRRRHFFPRH